MCMWCDGWWECDGEGGECGALPGPECPAVKTQTGWKVDCRVNLQDARGNEVLDSSDPPKPIPIHIVASVEPAGPNALRVWINGKEIDDNDGAKHPKIPYQPDKQGRMRHRQWRINCEHELTRELDGSAVLGEDGKPVKIRVQAYPYQFHEPFHGDNPDHVRPSPPGGPCWGPKVRVIYVPKAAADTDTGEESTPGDG